MNRLTPMTNGDRSNRHRFQIILPGNRRSGNSGRLVRREGGEFPGCIAAEANAVGDSDAVVGVADEAQAGKSGYAGGDAAYALPVADGILCHGAAPARDLRVFRFNVDANRFPAQNFAHFAADDGDEYFVRAR